MEESFKDFSKRVRNNNNRKMMHKPAKYRPKDIYCEERHLKWPTLGKKISYSLFSKIYRQFGLIVADILLQGKEVNITGIGTLIPVREESMNRRCDLNATLKLWYEDDEARKSKKKIYHTTNDKTKIVFSGSTRLSHYNIITFVPTQEFAEKLFKNRYELGMTNKKSLLV